MSSRNEEHKIQNDPIKTDIQENVAYTKNTDVTTSDIYIKTKDMKSIHHESANESERKGSASVNDNELNGSASANDPVRDGSASANDPVLDDSASANDPERDSSTKEEGSRRERDVECDEQKAPDGGWGWLIVCGCILMRMLVGGIVRSRGIIFIKIMDRFNGSATSTALISSLTTFIRLMIGPIVSILTNRFTCRTLSAVGTIVMASGFILSGFAPSQHFLFFSFGILGGIGRGIVLTPVPILLGNYFDKRRSRAFGLASTGFSIGGFAISPIVEILFQTYGFQGAFLILSGFCIQILVAAALFRPISLHRKITARSRGTKQHHSDVEQAAVISVQSFDEEDCLGSTMSLAVKDNSNNDKTYANKQVGPTDDIEQSEPFIQQNINSVSNGSTSEHKNLSKTKSTTTAVPGQKKSKLIDLTILKDVRYLCYVLATICFTLPSTGLFLPSLAKDRGASELKAAALISVSAGSDTVFRFLSGFILDMKPFRTIRPEISNVISFFQGITLLLFPQLQTYEQFCAVCALQGALAGIKNAQGSVIVMDMLGVDKLASSMAVTMTAQGLSVFLGPTISGQLKDHYGTYDGAFYFGAAATLVGAFIMAFGQIRKRYKDRTKAAKSNADTLNSQQTT